MQLTVHTTATAPAASRPLLAGIADDLGFVPNLAASIAESPTLLAAFDATRRAVGACPLDPVDREVAGLSVGVAVDNAYGVAFHSTVLDRLGLDGAEIDAMRSGRAPSDARQSAVYGFARALVLDRGRVDPAVIDAMREVGFSTADILDVVAECTFAGLVGAIDNLADRVELDPFLAPRAWVRQPV
jgi:alkylhydroperoxidase family enzyme